MVKKKQYSIPEVARMLGISRVALYKKVKKGQISATKVGRTYVISDRNVSQILGREMSPESKKRVDTAVKKAVRDYGDVLKKLSKE